MPVNTCTCGIRFAIGLMRCPRCKTVAPQYAALVKEEEMPRITVTDGPSNAGAAPGEVGYIEHEHGPEVDGLPDGVTMASEGGFAGAEDLTVSRSSPDYASMTLVQLRGAAKDRGLPTSGSKADLTERLTAGDTEPAAAPEEESE